MEGQSLKMQYLEETYENLTGLDGAEKQNGVFLARNRQTGRIVVKKYISISALPVYRELTGVSERHLGKVYDCAGNGREALAIGEFISGITLAEYLDQRWKVDEKTAVSMIQELLEALMEIHGLGIVHRDINPKNLMISGDGVLKVIDFGIARFKKEGQSRDTEILGTAGYAAPEQFGFTQTDERTDLYAAGVLLNKLLTGCFPTEQLYGGKDLQSFILRCTAMDAEGRFQTAREAREALRKLAAREVERGPAVKRTRKAAPGVQYSWLPGFRTGVLWKNMVALIGYLFLILFSGESLAECAVSVQTFSLELISILMYLWGANLLAANVGNWDRKLWPFRSWPKAMTIVLRVFLWIVLFYNGVMLDNYVRYDLMGLPRIQ